MNPGVVPWTIRLERGSDFWEAEVFAVDDQDQPITFLTTEITIFPPGNEPIFWNPENGKLTMPTPGQFLFNVSRAEISNYQWDKAEYKWSVTYSNGKVDANWMEGPVKVDAY